MIICVSYYCFPSIVWFISTSTIYGMNNINCKFNFVEQVSQPPYKEHNIASCAS